MRRRECLSTLAGAGVMVAGMAWGGRARAAKSNKSCYQLPNGGARCTTGFHDTPAMPARPCRSEACAACLAYMLQGFGARVTVEDVLARGAGPRSGCTDFDPLAETARLHAAAGRWRDRGGRGFLLGFAPLGSLHEVRPGNGDLAGMLDRLSRQPLLCGAAGHTTVVTQIKARYPGPSTPWREHVTVRDPWTPTAGLRPLTEAELARPSWVLGVSIRPIPAA